MQVKFLYYFLYIFLCVLQEIMKENIEKRRKLIEQVDQKRQ